MKIKFQSLQYQHSMNIVILQISMNPLWLEINRIKNYSTFIISVLDATVGVVSAKKI